MNSKLSLIAVIGKNREIGKDNHLLWNIPGDLARFRKITQGHPVIMGRKTFESIGHPLPGRTNIVVSHSLKTPGVVVVSSLEEAIEKAREAPGSGEIFVIGGGSLYGQAIARADRLYLTVVDRMAPGADTFFPPYDRFTKVLFREPHKENGLMVTYLTLEPT